MNILTSKDFGIKQSQLYVNPIETSVSLTCAVDLININYLVFSRLAAIALLIESVRISVQPLAASPAISCASTIR